MVQPTTSRLIVQILPMDGAAENLGYPSQAVSESSGVDLRAAIEGEVILSPGQRRLVPTGLKMAIPHGYEGQVRSRSGLALHHGVVVFNSPGTIDAGYRGEIGVILINQGQEPFSLTRGMRIAQLVFCQVVADVTWEEVLSLPQSHRGEGAFGSTGKG